MLQNSLNPNSCPVLSRNWFQPENAANSSISPRATSSPARLLPMTETETGRSRVSLTTKNKHFYKWLERPFGFEDHVSDIAETVACITEVRSGRNRVKQPPMSFPS